MTYRHMSSPWSKWRVGPACGLS